MIVFIHNHEVLLLWLTIASIIGFIGSLMTDEKNGHLKTLSNYGILEVNEGLFTNGDVMFCLRNS